MNADHPFWKSAERVWSQHYQFTGLRALLAQLFESAAAPPARDWQALLVTLMALAQDGTAQLSRAWPDEDTSALFNAFRVFSSAEVPEPIRVHDIDFVGARQAAKRARTATGTVLHPIHTAIPMDTILSTPPRQVLQRAEEAAEAADARARGAERRAVETARQLAGVQSEVLNLRQGVAIELGTLRSAAAAVEPIAVAAAQAVVSVREEIDALRRTMMSAEPAAVGGIRSAIAEAERRLQAQGARADQAEARAAATEQVLAHQQAEFAALRDGVRSEVQALRRAVATADPAAVAPISVALEDAERRLRAQEARVAAADVRHSHTERVLTEQRAEIESLKRHTVSADPAATTTLRREITAIEARLGQEAAELRQQLLDTRGGVRDEVAALRRLISSAEPATIAPIAVALADAEQRLRQQEAKAAHAEARIAAAERNVAGLREALRHAEPTSTTEGLRSEIAAMESRLSRESATIRAAVEGLLRDPTRASHDPPPPSRSDEREPPPCDEPHCSFPRNDVRTGLRRPPCTRR